MPSYRCTTNIRHNGTRYGAGEAFPSTAPPDDIARLIALGALVATKRPRPVKTASKASTASKAKPRRKERAP